MNLLFFITNIIGAYVLGSIPTAFIIGKLITKTDIRTVGSGNVGATNLLRIAGPFWGITALILDTGKGFLVIWITSRLFPGNNLLIVTSGLVAILGHIYSVFLGFKAGKGIAASLGVVVGLCPLEAGILFSVFFIIVLITRYISLGSIIAAFLFPIVIFIFNGISNIYLLTFSVLIAILVIYKHKTNIKRLFDGNENKISFKRKKNNEE